MLHITARSLSGWLWWHRKVLRSLSMNSNIALGGSLMGPAKGPGVGIINGDISMIKLERKDGRANSN